MARVWLRTSQGQAGFSPVEVLLAATIFGTLVTALVGAIIFGRAATADAGNHVRANFLAEEGLEAVRNMRDAAFSNATAGTFGLVQAGGVWTLSGTSDTNGIFTRQVTIASVDSFRKSITSTVTWSQGSSTAQAVATTRLTNWAANIVIPTSWANAIVGGGYNATGTNNGYQVAAQGNYAYLVRNVSGTANFFIINVSNPASPTLAGSLILASTPVGISVNGNYAYIANTNTSGEMQVVNVTNPASPTLTATFNATGTAAGASIYASGNYAYLGRAASGTGIMTIVNVTNPASPTTAGTYTNAGNITMNSVVVSGNYAYLGTNSVTSELLIVNIANPASPSLTGQFNASGSLGASSVAVFNNTAYIVGGTQVTAIDVATPSAPTSLDTLTLAGTGAGNGIALDNTGNYLFVGTANTTAELRVIDTTTPSNITLVRTVDATGTTSTINGVAYNTSLNIVVAASASDTQELITFTKN